MLETETPETVTAEDVVLTHYHLEKQREQDLALHEGEPEGLRGLTEVGSGKQAGETRRQDRTRGEGQQEYLGGLDTSDDFRVDAVNLWLTTAQDEANLRQQARSSTPRGLRPLPRTARGPGGQRVEPQRPLREVREGPAGHARARAGVPGDGHAASTTGCGVRRGRATGHSWCRGLWCWGAGGANI